ncbi:hypothetical protein COO60DRAFT_1516763, partial [Scenedesmus sp. NREL 46B-D3]
RAPMLVRQHVQANSLVASGCEVTKVEQTPRRRSLQLATAQADQTKASSMATEPGSSSKPVRLSSADLFDAMCTMLGGLEESRLVGYAGQWRTWDVGSDPASPPALIDDSVNIRLWRMTDAASRSVKQANLYQAPDKMAGPSTRFLPYLTGNAMSGRPDGYGLRVWEFKPDSDLINVGVQLRSNTCFTLGWLYDAAADAIFLVSSEHSKQHNQQSSCGLSEPMATLGYRWRCHADGSSIAARSCAHALAICMSFKATPAAAPGAVPSLPQPIMHTRARHAPVLRLAGCSLTRRLARQPAACGAQHARADGTATRFAYDQDGSLTTSSSPCSWSLGAAAAAKGSNAATSGPAAADGAAESAAEVVYQAYPDMSYCRVPRSLKALLESGQQPSVVFEGGAVLR